MTVTAQERLVTRLLRKVRHHRGEIIEFVEDGIDGADAVVVTYGITSRTAIPAIERARAEGWKVGHLRLVVVWPFPEDRIRELAARTRAFVVPNSTVARLCWKSNAARRGKRR